VRPLRPLTILYLFFRSSQVNNRCAQCWLYVLLGHRRDRNRARPFLDRPDPAQRPTQPALQHFIEAVQDNRSPGSLIFPRSGTAQVVENDGNRAVVQPWLRQGSLKAALWTTTVDIAFQTKPFSRAAWAQQAIGRGLLFPACSCSAGSSSCLLAPRERRQSGA